MRTMLCAILLAVSFSASAAAPSVEIRFTLVSGQTKIKELWPSSDFFFSADAVSFRCGDYAAYGRDYTQVYFSGGSVVAKWPGEICSKMVNDLRTIMLSQPSAEVLIRIDRANPDQPVSMQIN